MWKDHGRADTRQGAGDESGGETGSKANSETADSICGKTAGKANYEAASDCGETVGKANCETASEGAPLPASNSLLSASRSPLFAAEPATGTGNGGRAAAAGRAVETRSDAERPSRSCST
ncbi:MAG: hypothetical protein WCJ35_05095 [Planctomycetota bacterium]